MRSFDEILQARQPDWDLPDTITAIEANEQDLKPETVKKLMADRLKVLEDTVVDALQGRGTPKIASDDVPSYRSQAALSRQPLCGSLIWRASEIAVALATCSASMGRIVAAPTAGSCGILPGLMFAWKEQRGASDAGEKLLDGLIISAAVGEVIAARATLAGAQGGCQAECGAAAAMGAAALCWMEGGQDDQPFQAAALALKSILGLACDPVAGLVEVPCIKRNGTLVALGAVSADLALAGIRSVIPPDEVIDAMAEVGRSLPSSLRETARGGCAITPTGKMLTLQLTANRHLPGE